MTEQPQTADSPLRGSVAIVTGGGSGIGQATSVRLAREGARVVVVDLDSSKTDATTRRLAASGLNDHLGLSLNVRREQDMEAMAQQTLEAYGRIDSLVHCAGILHSRGGRPRSMVELSAEEWDDVLEINLRGTFLANRSVLQSMMKQRAGQIINISSTLGLKGEALESAYCASKFGVIGLSESLAEEVRAFGIKVQLICPGAVDTPFWEQHSPLPGPEQAISPDQVADLIAYLLKLPPDTMLQNVVLTPFRTRKRKRGPVARAAPEGGTARKEKT